MPVPPPVEDLKRAVTACAYPRCSHAYAGTRRCTEAGRAHTHIMVLLWVDRCRARGETKGGAWHRTQGGRANHLPTARSQLTARFRQARGRPAACAPARALGTIALRLPCLQSKVLQRGLRRNWSAFLLAVVTPRPKVAPLREIAVWHCAPHHLCCLAPVGVLPCA